MQYLHSSGVVTSAASGLGPVRLLDRHGKPGSLADFEPILCSNLTATFNTLRDEFAALALHHLDKPMLNGETIGLDGALRMAPR